MGLSDFWALDLLRLTAQKARPKRRSRVREFEWGL